MKRTLSLLFLGFLLFVSQSDAIFLGNRGAGGSQDEGAAAFCDGTLFCWQEEDYSWDTTSGVEDSALDADDEWTDQWNGSSPTTPKVGSYALGIRDANTTDMEEALSTPGQSEFYYEGWYYTTQGGNNWQMKIMDTNGNLVAGIYKPSDDILHVLYDNADKLNNSEAWVMDTYTWIWIGVYCKIDGGGSGEFWVYANETGNAFVYGDLVHEATGLTFTNSSDTADKIHFRGPEGDGAYNFWDNVRVKSGDPGWPTS